MKKSEENQVRIIHTWDKNETAPTEDEGMKPNGVSCAANRDGLDIEFFWKIVEEDFDPFFSPFFKMSKRLLDIKPRHIGSKELVLPLDPMLIARRPEIEVAIQGGLDSVNLNFNEGRVLQALSHALDDRNFPVEFHLTRPELFKYLGPDMSGREKERVQKTIIQLARKTFPFVFKMKNGRFDKKTGEPLWTVALTYAPLFALAAIYEDVQQLELPDVLGPKVEKRFSHYIVRFNRNAVGEVEDHFRLIPSHLGLEIIEFRRKRNQRPRAAELAFIEYLYQRNLAVIEINFLKLADRLHIKMKKLKEPARLKRHVRAVLDRCYETALGLKFALAILQDQPAGKGITKEIIRLNPDRFPYLDPPKKP